MHTINVKRKLENVPLFFKMDTFGNISFFGLKECTLLISHTHMYIHILYTDHIATQLYSKLKQNYQVQNIMNKMSFLKNGGF